MILWSFVPFALLHTILASGSASTTPFSPKIDPKLSRYHAIFERDYSDICSYIYLESNEGISEELISSVEVLRKFAKGAVDIINQDSLATPFDVLPVIDEFLTDVFVDFNNVCIYETDLNLVDEDSWLSFQRKPTWVLPSEILLRSLLVSFKRFFTSMLIEDLIFKMPPYYPEEEGCKFKTTLRFPPLPADSKPDEPPLPLEIQKGHTNMHQCVLPKLKAKISELVIGTMYLVKSGKHPLQKLLAGLSKTLDEARIEHDLDAFAEKLAQDLRAEQLKLEEERARRREEERIRQAERISHSQRKGTVLDNCFFYSRGK